MKDLVKIWAGSVLSASADLLTSQIGLKYPELAEMNPLFDPKKEIAFGGGGGTFLLALGKALKVDDKVTSIFSMIPPTLPLLPAANNLAWIIYAHRKLYPWNECPLLYPEIKVKS